MEGAAREPRTPLRELLAKQAERYAPSGEEPNEEAHEFMLGELRRIEETRQRARTEWRKVQKKRKRARAARRLNRTR